MMQHKGKWMISIVMTVCLIVVLGFGNQQTMATAPTKKPVINVFGSDPVNINSHRSFVAVQGIITTMAYTKSKRMEALFKS